jgi:proteasome accessory factor B
MARNREMIRQWTLLQKVATARGNTIPKLAKELEVNARTIRRDLDALQAAGFPVYDETINGTKFWRVKPQPLGGLARNAFSFSELCALYFSRTLIECFAGTHLLADVQSAFDKVESVLTPGMKKFIDRLPKVLAAKPAGAKRQGKTTYQAVAQLLDAMLHQRVVRMRYHSQSSGREKEYLAHPYRLMHAQGGLYLIAFVPAYSEVRTFAVERIRRVAVEQETFDPIAEMDSEPFKGSLGAFRGEPTKIQLRFHPKLAAHIKERTFHSSQRLKDRTDGSVMMTLEVCDDYALRAWIMSFGCSVRVLAPESLADWVSEELLRAGQQYGGDDGTPVIDSDLQPGLPGLFERIGRA